jgi:hypothetical protein
MIGNQKIYINLFPSSIVQVPVTVCGSFRLSSQDAKSAKKVPILGKPSRCKFYGLFNAKHEFCVVRHQSSKLVSILTVLHA